MKMKIYHKKVAKSAQSDYFCSMKTKIIAIVFISAAILTSCNTDSKKQKYGFPETEQEGLPYGVTDTINGTAVSDQCAIMNHDLESLLRRVEAVKSPDMLMMVKADFEKTLDSLTIGSGNMPAEEQAVIDSLRTSIISAYKDVCREYEIAPEGVIDNLNHCIQRVNNAKSRDDLIRFMDVRRGMLSNLDIIHLCVESSSNRIPEVKRLAQQLKTNLEAKKRQFNL